MQTDFFFATLFNLLMNLTYTIVALFIGIIALKIIDKKLLTSIEIQQELKKNNMAVAIFSSTILLFVALIVLVYLFLFSDSDKQEETPDTVDGSVVEEFPTGSDIEDTGPGGGEKPFVGSGGHKIDVE